MKKKLAITAIVALLGFILYATLIKRVFIKEIKVRAPLEIIRSELTETKSIAKWYLPFADLDSNNIKMPSDHAISGANTNFILSKATAFDCWYTVSDNSNKKDFVFSILPDSNSHFIIRLNYESTLFNQLFGANSLVGNAEKSLQNLTSYFEDVKKMYGYKISLTGVTDTAVLFTSKLVANSQKRESIKSLYESLIKYAEEKNAGYDGVRIFYSVAEGKDSIHLYTGIGVTNTEKTPINNNNEVISLKRMPYKGKLLSAFYQGSFGNIKNAIDALEKFKTDNKFTSMAIPFVKFMSNGIDFYDDQQIQATIYYPIM